MESIAEIRRKAIRDYEPYFRRGLITAQESDRLAKRDVAKYLEGRQRTINALVGMVI